MYDPVTMKLNVEPLIISALREDITSEDVSTNCVMPGYKEGTVDLICKEDGVICGLQVFERVFTLLDEKTEAVFSVSDGDLVEKGQKIGTIFARNEAEAGKAEKDILSAITLSRTEVRRSPMCYAVVTRNGTEMLR